MVQPHSSRPRGAGSNGWNFGEGIGLRFKIFGSRGLSPAIVAEHLAIDRTIKPLTVNSWLEYVSQHRAPGGEVKLEEAYGVITKRAGHYRVMLALSQLLNTDTVIDDATKQRSPGCSKD